MPGDCEAAAETILVAEGGGTALNVTFTKPDATTVLGIYRCMRLPRGLALEEAKCIEIPISKGCEIHCPEPGTAVLPSDEDYVTDEFVKSGDGLTYTLYKSNPTSADAGLYLMKHGTDSANGTCTSAVYYLGSGSGSVQKARIQASLEVHGPLADVDASFSSSVTLLLDGDECLNATSTVLSTNDGSWTVSYDNSSGAIITCLGVTDARFTVTISEEFSLSQTVSLSRSDSCSDVVTNCNGAVECDDFTDETGNCRTTGNFARLAVRSLSSPIPPSTGTVCLYSLGSSARIEINRKYYIDTYQSGPFCFTYSRSSSSLVQYKYESGEFAEQSQGEMDRYDGGLITYITVTSSSSYVKNIVSYNKVLGVAEMKSRYVTGCGVDVTDVYLDHHGAVSIATAAGQISSNYAVMAALCSESALPAGAVNLVTKYICSTGKVVSNHCYYYNYCSGGVESEGECDYYESSVVAAGSDCGTQAKIHSSWNNDLALIALNTRCSTGDDCKIYADSLLQGKNDTWSDNTVMSWTNWASKVEPDQVTANFSVIVSSEGSWSVDGADIPDGSTRLCKLTSGSLSDSSYSNSYVYGLTFGGGSSQYSRVEVSRTTTIAQFTMCWAGYGTGVVLQYTGTSSITDQDIKVMVQRSDENSESYITVFVAGFPEYFTIPDGTTGDYNKYVCVRWEKATGRVDLSSGGTWYIGTNAYATSRQVGLPKTGTLVVGADLSTSTGSVVVGDDRGEGYLTNLVIWDEFLNPAVLKETSEQTVCTTPAKTDAWLPFEKVIAGIMDVDMYGLPNYCQSHGATKKRSVSVGLGGSELRSRQARSTTSSITISADMDEIFKVTEENEDVFPGVSADITGDYTLAYINGSWMVQVGALSKVCINNLSPSISLSGTLSLYYNTGLTAFQVGDSSDVIPSSSDDTEPDFDGVYANTDGSLCFTNLLSPSDYAPYDSYLTSIILSGDDSSEPLCAGETVTTDTQGTFTWPTTNTVKSVSLNCPYGNASDSAQVALVTRQCQQNGWGNYDLSACGVKQTISNDEATEYFDTTEVTEETIEQFTDTISQVVTEEEEVTSETLDTASVALEKLTNSTGDVTITPETTKTVLEIADTINTKTSDETIKQQEAETQAASKVVKSVESVVAAVQLDEATPSFKAKTSSVSVAAVKPSLLPTTSDNEGSVTAITASFSQTLDGTDILINEVDDVATDSTITIPSAIYSSTGDKNVWFTSFRSNSSLFATDTTFEKQGQILGAGVGSDESTTESFEAGSGVELTFAVDEDLTDSRAMCQFWYMPDNEPAYWSSEGMIFKSKTGGNVTCEALHLTNFAILVNPSNTLFTGAEELVLQIITIAGCGMSIIGLLITIIGLAVFKQIRNVLTNKVHIGLATSLLVSYILLLVGADQTQSEGACYFFSIAIQLSFLCAFCWMLCEAGNLYLRLVVVFDSYSRLFLKFSLFSTLVPLLIVIITIIVEFAGNNGAYIIKEESSGTRLYCFLQYKARMSAFVLPLLLILCANLIVFVLVMRVILRGRKVGKAATGSEKTQWLARLRSAVAVSTLIGLSWIIGVFAAGEASFAINIIFALFNSLQGVLICYLYCFAKTDVTNKWKTSLRSSFLGSTTKDKTSGAGTSSGGAFPMRTAGAATKSTSATGGNLGKLVSSSKVSERSSEVEVPVKPGPPVSTKPPVEANNVYFNTNTEDPIYDDLATAPPPEHDDDEEDHIYEDHESFPPLRPVGSRPDPADNLRLTTAQRRELALKKSLAAGVREKVENYENLIEDARLSTLLRVQLAADSRAEGDTSFEVGGKEDSDDSRSPIKL